ncbi:hypothetical protein ASPCADRAFT_126950 [Aspergillus carbonarius ITEM 5010]|uniref:Uncharacterized protein n=1 Tax=Aspergillus carbonarius (strain ITEM 5010) TaxID=602072 RepID=A0A1R3S058_ASPC5|nr:hypothetical protein ASPCADRAFT_126950 [Aspergillus carbonarius ITEM 5010]
MASGDLVKHVSRMLENGITSWSWPVAVIGGTIGPEACRLTTHYLAWSLWADSARRRTWSIDSRTHYYAQIGRLYLADTELVFPSAVLGLNHQDTNIPLPDFHARMNPLHILCRHRAVKIGSPLLWSVRQTTGLFEFKPCVMDAYIRAKSPSAQILVGQTSHIFFWKNENPGFA